MLFSFTAFIVPFIFCVISALSWAFLFRKTFFESLAPSLIVSTLIVFLFGMLFPNGGLLIGLICYSAFVIGLLVWKYNNESKLGLGNDSLLKITKEVIIFFVLYAFIFAINVDKRFYEWDEFSHWGRFLKETLRLNSLFCTSNASMSHKDYVPIITVFEYIWCRLSFRYVEADAYCAQQVLMVSMMLPVFSVFDYKKSFDSLCIKSKNLCSFIYAPLYFCVLIVMLLIPLGFDSGDGFRFYHSIYKDYCLGVVLFYCVYVIYQKSTTRFYKMMMVTSVSTFLVMTKMVAIAYLPTIFMLYYVFSMLCEDMPEDSRQIGKFLICGMALIPIVIWLLYNFFVAQYIVSDGIQSYSGISASKVLQMIFHPLSSGSSLIISIRDKFVKALVYRKIAFNLSYFLICIICGYS